MFDITADHIACLNDELLRELIGRLCEAEASAARQSPLTITWGGNQTSPDGGIDVRVAMHSLIAPARNLPRANCGFQVKAEDMPRRAILEEMKPNGSLRDSIRALADVSGAYIIVSSQGSTSDTSLTNRRAAMAEAVGSLSNAASLHLDFYDRTRIATWVRDHAGIVLWVRERVARSIPGWKAYGDWTGSADGVNPEYILDDRLRVHGPNSRENCSALDGLQHIRARLAQVRGVVRLVGLSGTGKTRFAQALFDDRLGTRTLLPSLAIYTNLSDDPSPQPVALATDLISQHKRAVLVIDNCPPDLHRSLSSVCRASESQLSVLSIEYDVREDQPEGTDVFELQRSSDDLIETLLQRRFPALSRVNAQTVAHFASGNARVALALAGTVTSGESLAELQDADLFQRLFEQRHGSNPSLLQTAQACSLVYSFQGEDASQAEHAELLRLAQIFGIDIRSFYQDLVELHHRDLLQKRGVWRALLPHAVANRLAALALENILPSDFQRFWEDAPPRLLRSFSRRLGYLHTSAEARRIVEAWLAPEGILGRVELLDELHKALLANVAPVAPTATLEAISRACQRQRENGGSLEGEGLRVILHSLAFEASMFDQAFASLIDLIEYEAPGPYANQLRNDFSSLFHIYLSGTHATVEQRIAALESLSHSPSDQRREFGYSGLNAMLQSSHFTSFQHFDFGGRPRDFGLDPRTRAEVRHWFTSALELCKRMDATNSDASIRVRKIVSDHLRGLWSTVSLFDEVETLCREFAERRSWPEGWSAIRSIRRFREEPLPTEQDTQLSGVERALEPRSVQDRVRAFVLRGAHAFWDDLGLRDYEAQHLRLQTVVIDLGRAIGQDTATFDELLPELVLADNGTLLAPFSKGYIERTSSPREGWHRLVRAFVAADPEKRNIEILACYMFNLASADPQMAEELLAEIVNHPILAAWFPNLQSRVHVSDEGLERLRFSLENELAPVDRYRNLGFAKAALSDDQLSLLLPLIGSKNNGFDIALDCIWMRLATSGREDEPASSEAIIMAGRNLLADHIFSRDNRFDHYHFAEVAKHCLSRNADAPVAVTILQNAHAASRRFQLGFGEANAVVCSIMAVQPVASLDTIFATRSITGHSGMDHMFDHDDLLGAPFDSIPESLLLEWCDQDAESRYTWVASSMCPFIKGQNTGMPRWKETAMALLGRAPNRIELLRNYIDQLRPTSWTGSLSMTWEANVRLLDSLPEDQDPSVRAFIAAEQARLAHQIAELRMQEDAQERSENERFE
jgi:hypothetical protein